MKTITLFITLLFTISLIGLSNDKGSITGSNSTSISSLIINTTSETQAISQSWVDEYSKLQSVTQITLAEIKPDAIIDESSVWFVTDKCIPANANWRMLIGRNAIVPIINSNNPLKGDLNRYGISAEKVLQIMADPQIQDWGALLNRNQDIPARIYVINSMVSETAVANYQELISKIREDIFAIGFCRLPEVLNQDGSGFTEGISILPLDKNNNGRLDNFENIYSNAEDFSHGVWIGKYPKQMTESIFAVAAAKPSDEAQLNFLSWILKDGQKILNENGYIVLTGYQEKAGLEGISPAVQTEEPHQSGSSFNWILVLAAVIIIGLAVMIVYSIVRMFSKNPKAENELKITNALNTESINVPHGLYYGKSHTWSFMEKDGTVKVGIDDFLPRVTGMLTKIKMRESGDAIRKGEKMVTINHDGKQLDIYAPVSGIIKENNKKLNNNSALLNDEPYTDGWIYSIIPKNWTREIDFMLFGEDYKEWLKDEFSRLKDFLARSVKTNSSAYQHIILQDGGELTENVLADLEPKVWEDFQNKFLDITK
ncbi:MAG TPA: hypothetical protein VK212_10990 [Lentimicrobium sp.]|nr:hypothetical protein [Lentimicrobium sp.]